MLPTRTTRLLPLLCLLLTACGRCGGDTASTAQSDVPPLALVQHVPANTLAIAHTGDLGAVLVGYMGARDELSQISADIGLLETDLTNTLGVDLRRPETLRDAGVDLERGALAFALADEPVVLIATNNSRRFEERLTSVLTAQPIALDATPERVALDDGHLLLFRREGAATVLAAALVRDDHVALWPQEPADARASAELLLNVQPDNSLGTNEKFRGLWGQRNAETPVCVWASLAASEQESGAAAALSTAGEAFAQLAGADAEALLACAALTEAGVTARFALDATNNPIGDFTPPAAPPTFSNIVNEDAQGVMRWTLPPSVFAELIGRVGGEDLAPLLAPYEQDLGISFDTILTQALGSRGALLITRTRMLTLRRAMNSGAPGEWAAGVGLVGVIELQQHDLTERLLRSVVANMGEGATAFEEGDRLIVEFNDAASDIGNLVLDGDLLYLLPARERAGILTQLETGEGATLAALRGEGAQALLTARDANGLYIDLARVVDGPIGQIGTARLPDEVKRALARFDSALVNITLGDARLDVSLDLRFATPEMP